MSTPSLSSTALILGLYLIVTRIWAWLRPAAAEAWLRAFPRNRRLAPFLSAVVMAWAAWWVHRAAGESESFGAWQPVVIVAAPVAWWVTWRFMDSFLTARAYAALLLLVARPLLFSAFPHESPLRLPVVIYTYGMVVAGITFGFSPHRLRDLIDWELRARERFRAICALGMAAGVLLVLAGVFLYPRLG